MTFPSVVTGSSLADYNKCPQSYFLRYVRRLGRAGPDRTCLVAGQAFAAALEKTRLSFYRDGVDDVSAMAVGLATLIKTYGDAEGSPTISALIDGFGAYLERWPLGRDYLRPYTAQTIECNFRLPLDITHPETGDPIIYQGRFDWIAQMEDGAVFVVDEKTTSRNSPVQWDLHGSQIGYLVACRAYGIKAAGTIIRTVVLREEASLCYESITYYKPWLADRWLENLHRIVERMVEDYKAGYWPYNYGHACVMYGGCTYRELCRYESPDSSPFRSEFVEHAPYYELELAEE